MNSCALSQDETPESLSLRKTRWLEPAALLMVGLLLMIHGARLLDQPIRGEESRWAMGALEMIRTGDWIVPRQQGTPFPERPPLNSWLMAISASCLGSMSLTAIRLPSLIASLATSWLLYGYIRRWRSAAEAAGIGLIYATLGQVLELGHLGESEAVLTALIAGSLLLWHDAWLDQRPLKAWLVGFSLAALAALAKGIQGPVYFVAVTSITVLLERRWQALSIVLDWRWLAGLLSMIAIIAAWAIPFVMLTDLQAFRDIWAGLIADRVGWSGWLEHLAAYPLEILGCWLPWSLFLIPLSQRSVREGLRDMQVPLRFALLAILITFPSVWWVTGARGRYYMPLAPMAAIVFGSIVISLWSRREEPSLAAAWWRYVRVMGGLGIAIATLLLIDQYQGHLGWASDAWVPGVLTVAVITAVLGTLLLLLPRLSSRLQKLPTAGTSSLTMDLPWKLSFLTSAILCGWLQSTVFVNLHVENGKQLLSRVQQLRERIPSDQTLVSFGPVHHRFGYLWKSPIPMLDWPAVATNSPPPSDWFVIDFQPEDSPSLRISGRGRTWGSTSGTLPFAWEFVQSIPVDKEGLESRNWVIIGRVLRNEEGDPIQTAQGIPSADQVMR